jgi:hypothetical protein
MSEEYVTCDRCGNERNEDFIQTVELTDTHKICGGCATSLNGSVVNYHWQDRYTEEQHQRAVSLLSERDVFECVIESYEDGQIVLHTKYVSSDVVTDFCNHFGFEIARFGPQWLVDQEWPCMTSHGDTFEIVLEYNHYSRPPIPTQARFEYASIDGLDGNDKQF